MHYEDFEEVMRSLHAKKREVNLLLGNGFSMSYDPAIFSYNALYDFVASLNDPVLTGVLKAMKTKNFELMMAQLNAFSDLLEVFDGDDDLKGRVSAAHQGLRKSLINAIKALHPEHVFKIPEDQSKACAEFVNRFIGTGGSIFTSNYDLLLYWVLMRQSVPNARDGFGYELLNPIEVQANTEPEEWSRLHWGPNRSGQNIFYLHGSLPLFDTGVEVEKEQYDEAGYLLENIRARIEQDDYPVFVTAGDGQEKLAQIRSNPYLADCYENLCRVDGSIISLGFGFGEYDSHIIEALNRATHAPSKSVPKLWSVYVGVFSDADKHRAAELEHALHAKVHTYNAKSAKIWGKA